MRYHDERSRRSWQNPEQILVRTGLGPGDTVIDIGCGEGFFTLPAARLAGSSGKIIGIDINGSAVSRMLEQARREGLGNVDGIVGSGEETLACEGCADLIFFGIDLHDFSDPQKVLQNARRMIKPGGTLCNLDWQKRETPFGPPVSIRFDEETAATLIREAGFTILRIEEIPLWFYLITAAPGVANPAWRAPEGL
ncbi:MAG: class I SAM-dependent methyltransferase [Methanoregulaceae archaeon]|nr:class I SAM-dependent methyltransferase [Methanoregulaceae archaeon]